MLSRQPRLCLPVLGCALLFPMLFFFSRRFVGLTLDGWFDYFTYLQLEGKVPYRDFSVFCPPFQLLKDLLFAKIFGLNLFSFRVLGIIESCLLFVLLFFVLADETDPWRAFLFSLTATVAQFGDCADPIYYYNRSVLLLSLAAFFLYTRKNATWLAHFFVGVLCSADFLTKQTVGLVVLVGFSFFYLVQPGKRKFLLPFAVGNGLVLLLTLGYLTHHGATGAFVDQVFIRGSAAKGGLLRTLSRPVFENLVHFPEGYGAYLGILLGVAVLVTVAHRAIVPLILVAVIFFSGRNFTLVFTTLSFFFLLTVFVARRRCDFFIVFCLLVAGSFAFSWRAFEIMLFPSLALCLLLLSEKIKPVRLSHALLAVVMGKLVYTAVTYRATVPFDWAWHQETGIFAPRSSESAEGYLAGLSLSHQTHRHIKEAVKVITENSRPEDPVLVFPAMPIYLLLSHRHFYGQTPIWYWDVCPDLLAADLLQSMQKDPPKLVAFFSVDAEAKRYMDSNFRTHLESEVSKVSDALAGLAAPAYETIYIDRTTYRFPFFILKRR